MENKGRERIKYSVIVLLDEESEDFSLFIHELYRIFLSKKDPFEIIIVANAKGDFLANELKKLSECEYNLKAFALNKQTSQAVSLMTGFNESSGDIIAVCGSYQQISKDSFNALLDSLDDETDIISPWRQGRVDPPFNQFQSKAFNFLVKKIAGLKINDLSCTVKIFRREVLSEIKLYGNMYRFLPIIAAKKGFKNKEVKCEHFQERGKTGLYGLTEYVSRIIDILTLYFNIRFSRKPLRFFGMIGLSFLMIGFFVICYVLIQKIFMNHPIGGRPVLLFSVLFMVLGVQAASVGLLGEIIAFTQGRISQEYNIEKEI
jgi:glycosyltransferase involved in cell wall biosynthesis